MLKIPYSGAYEPGSWKGLKTNKGRSALFTCPMCGYTGRLTEYHKIHNTGVVFPSVVCSNCNEFHDFIHLEGWNNVE